MMGPIGNGALVVEKPSCYMGNLLEIKKKKNIL